MQLTLSTLLLKLGIAIAGIFWAASIYDINIVTLEGNTLAMKTYQGKKIMIIVLPTERNQYNTTCLHRIDSIGKVYGNKLVIIGIPSLDDGYHTNEAKDISRFYDEFMSKEVVITGGMYTRKGAAGLQHPLFAWLTNKEKNSHFDQDVKGSGQMFFINEQGELYGVLGPETMFGGRMLSRMLQ